MKGLIFIVTTLCIILSGCAETVGNLELEGHVFDDKTNVSIPDRKIIIQAMVKIENEFASIYLGDFYTDNAGKFTYKLKKVRNVCLYNFCVVGDSAYAFSNNIIDLTALNRNSKVLKFRMDKLTDLAIKIDRRSSNPHKDTLYIAWESNGIDGKTLYPYKIENYQNESRGGLEWIGGKVKSIVKTKVIADKKTIIRWKLFRNWKYEEITDTIFCLRNTANSVHFKY
jgi:hypothetical protein